MTSAFWIAASALIVIGLLLLLLPLSSNRSRLPWGLISSLAIAVPVITVALYLQVGTPQALSPQLSQTGDGLQQMQQAIAQLQQRLQAQPDNVEGWVLLGRSYRAVQNYPGAEQAFQQALTLDTENPTIQVELAEAMTFAAGTARFSTEAEDLLRQAVSQDPYHQKGLWLLGVAAAQRGDDQAAISHWERLQGLLEPGSSVATTIATQLQALRERMEQPGATIPVSLALQPAQPLPQQSVLYVFIRPAGVEQGMPLAVRRIPQPEFPVTVTLGNGDMLQADTQLETFPALAVSARLSMNGSATPASGDIRWQTVPFSWEQPGEVTLQLTQVIP